MTHSVTMRLALGLGVALLTTLTSADDKNDRGGKNRPQPQPEQRQPRPQERPSPRVQQPQPRPENRPNLGGNPGGNRGGNREPIINRNRGDGGNNARDLPNRGNQTTRKIEVPQNNPNPPNAGRNLPGRRDHVPDLNTRVLQNRDRGDNNPGRNNQPKNNQPKVGDRPVLKPKDNDNRPGGGVTNRNPDRNPVSDRPVLKPRDNDNRPNRNPGDRNPNIGDRPVLKPRDNDNRPGAGVINRPGDRNPIGDRPVLRPRDDDKRPGNNGRPGIVNRPNSDGKPGDRGIDRNRELRDNLKKVPPIADNRRQDNERGLIRNRDQAHNFLDKNPKLRDRVQDQDGKVDLSRLHLARDRKDRISTVVNKNGDLRLDRDLADRLRHRDRVRDLNDLDNRLKNFRDPDFIKRHPELKHADFRHASGHFQHQLHDRRFDRLVDSRFGRNLNLQQQFHLHQRGDIARQMNLNVALINHGGWKHRYMGPVFGGYTASSFSAWYCGPGWYPSYCWTPMWSPWVDWCWWDTCPIIYDPRPIYCRPIYYYDPCPVWVVYDYPVWQPLPVVASGTWVDLPTPVLVDNTDVRLLAVRFVDSGHADQQLGTRYRVWFENDSKQAITTPFNVLLMAGNSPHPSAEMPQAGVTVQSMEPGEMQVVDLRLPYAANRMNPVDGKSTPFAFLHVLVDSHRQLQDVQPENNGTVVARTDILPVDPAAFAPDVAAAAPGAMVSIAGEGFGPEPGQLIVSVNGEETEATAFGWYDLGVQFELPNVSVNGPVDAEVLVVRGDGAASNPVTVRIAPEGKLEQAVLPEAPLP